MKEYKDFPYGIDFVLDLDYPGIKRYGIRHGEEDIDCPFCDRKRKAHVNYAKKVFRCNACQVSGGIVKLHQKATGINHASDAIKDLNAKWGSLSEEDRKNLAESNEKLRSMTIKETEPFPPIYRDMIYGALLKELQLLPEHKEDLLRRGLTEDDIIRNGYKSYPKAGLFYLAEKSLTAVVQTQNIERGLAYWIGQHEYGIPGYYSAFKTEFSLMQLRDAGYMIPVRDVRGMISAFQIRNFQNKAPGESTGDFRKYTWFSSRDKKQGCGVRDCNQIHFTGFDYEASVTPEKVLLTEGCLKADVASSLMKQIGMTTGYAPFIAVMGVNNTSQLPQVFEYLKQHGTKCIQLCFDMDYKDKEQVEAARDKVKDLIKEAGLEVQSMNWDPQYKGIDDYLLAKKNKLERRDNQAFTVA